MQFFSLGVVATFLMPIPPKTKSTKKTPARRPLLGLQFRPIDRITLDPDSDEKKLHPKPGIGKIIQLFSESIFDLLVDLFFKIKVFYKDFKHLDPEVQQQILFSLSTLIGTVVFYIIFECVHFFIKLQVFMFPRLIAAPSYTFGIAYSLSYLISVLYQHALNRYLVFTPSDTFCESLLQTYVVYGISLVGTSIIGSVIMSITGMTPELVLTITLPLSGLSNYVLLSALNKTGSSGPASRRQQPYEDDLIII